MILLQACVLALILVCTGCEPEKDAPPPEEVTIEELNLALDYLAKSGEEIPDTVQQLLELPQLSGTVLPETPPGIVLIIDREHNRVIPYFDESASAN